MRWNRNETRYFVCRRCDVVFQFPQPIAGSLTEFYSEDYYRKTEGEQGATGYTNYDEEMDLSLAHVLFEPVRRLARTPGGKLLDIGCATGKILEVARENGWNARGVEISAWAAEGARRKGFEVHTGTLEEAHLPEASMDVITMFDVIEHIPDPRKTLHEVHRLLRPGGTLVVQTPNANGFGARFLYRSRSMIVQPGAHLILFSPSGLRRMLEQQGFLVDRLRTGSLSSSFRSYVLTAMRRSGKKILKAMNYRVAGLDLSRKIKRKEVTELPQFSFNDVILLTATRASAST